MMDYLLYYASLSTFLLLIFFFFTKRYLQRKTTQEKQPPTPPSRRFIGHLHLIKHPLHRSLQQLSSAYGSIYFLQIGFVPTLVISSPNIVEECFTKNDIVLANRPRRRTGKHLNFEWTTLGSVSYGPLWRDLRRLASLELFSTFRLNLLADIRLEEMRSLVKGLFLTAKEKRACKVEMRPRFCDLSFNVIMRMVTGKTSYFGDEIEVFRDTAREVFELSGASNPVDFFPFLKWVPFQKMERKMLVVRRKMDAFLDGLIEECKRPRTDDDDDTGADMGNRKAMIYNLLQLQESDPLNYSDQIIKGIIMIMLTAGTDTSAVTMEWALSLLLNNPDVFQKAREEIDSIISHDRLVNESDLSELPCIHNILNETLRLFPAAPLLVPHEASQDCTIAGYHVKKGTMVIINAWAIHRDPELWDDPLRFKPDRFEGLNSETFKSRWIPFGLGRRSCPGANLASKVVALNLAALIQCFDWEKIDGKNVDLDEGFGLTMPKLRPLEVICRARKCMINVLSQI